MLKQINKVNKKIIRKSEKTQEVFESKKFINKKTGTEHNKIRFCTNNSMNFFCINKSAQFCRQDACSLNNNFSKDQKNFYRKLNFGGRSFALILKTLVSPLLMQ